MTTALERLFIDLKKTPMTICANNEEVAYFDITKRILKTFIDNPKIMSLRFNLRVYDMFIDDYENVNRLTIIWQKDLKHNLKNGYFRDQKECEINKNFKNMDFTRMTNLQRRYKTDYLTFTAKNDDNEINLEIFNKLNTFIGPKFDKLFQYHRLENTIPQSNKIEVKKIKI